MDRQTVTAWLADRHPGTYSFPPSPKKFLHSFLGCLKNSRSRFKSFIFFRKKLRSFDGFDQMSALWSMFWFKTFRNFLRKIFWTFDHWSEILSLSAGRPISQGVCPALLYSTAVTLLISLFQFLHRFYRSYFIFFVLFIFISNLKILTFYCFSFNLLSSFFIQYPKLLFLGFKYLF
jgi:hypothetical protein